MTNAPPPGTGSQKRSLGDRIRNWPLIGKIAAGGCGCLTLAVVVLIVISVIGVALGLGESTEPAADDQATSESSPEPSESGSPTEEDSPSPSQEESSEEESAEEETPSPSEEESSSPADEEPSTDDESSETPTEADSPDEAESTEEPAEDPAEESEAETPSEEPTPSDEPDQDDTAVVSRIVDGDTIELDSGDQVRITGIDTPERGECNFEAASDRMAELVLGETVTLVQDGDDTDRYERLLRYVDVGSTDAGLTLIQEGLAIARYDSRDGYGAHSREADYIAADEATPQQGCPEEEAPEPEPEPEPAPEPAPDEPNAECSPNYDPCVPPFPPDLNCDDISGPVRVIGDDPHRLDADGDGIACE